jgi:Holliday junction resolvase-like predicted endonuclease
MKSPKQLKHDSICRIVADELKSRGWTTITNKEYSTNKCGEIDVIGFKDNYAMYVEVKCRLYGKNGKKAQEQLHRARDYCDYHKDKRLFLMLAYERHGTLKYELIK